MRAGPLLQVQGLTKEFGGLTAVRAVDFTVSAGQIKALIGPNGAGKTTIFNLIAGALPPTRGRVLFEGDELPRNRPHAVAARGIARTFQLVRLFGEMTVLENVLVGCHRRGRAGWAASAFRTRAMRDEEKRLAERAWGVLHLVGLDSRAHLPAAALAYGEQRLVEIARALATGPRLLLLDEPGAGGSPVEHLRLGDLIRRIRDGGTTVLLVDHHMDFVMDLSDELMVLSYGTKLAEGTPTEVRTNPDVIAAYLGEEPAEPSSDEPPPRERRRAVEATRRADAIPGDREPDVLLARPALEVQGLDVFYGRVQALRDVALRVARGELVTIVGPNGAGKSTLLRAITGLVTIRAGAVRLEGEDIAGMRPEEIVRLGVAMVPEGRDLFPALSVRQNLALGAYSRGRRARRRSLEADLDRVLALFPALGARLHQRAATLSGGEQQMVALGRALMARPRLLLLDEPSVGLGPLVIGEIFRALAALKTQGLTILLVEQNARAAFRIADRGYALGPGGVLSGAASDQQLAGSARLAYGLQLAREESSR